MILGEFTGWLIGAGLHVVFSDVVFEENILVYAYQTGVLWISNSELVVGFEECGNVEGFGLSLFPSIVRFSVLDLCSKRATRERISLSKWPMLQC